MTTGSSPEAGSSSASAGQRRSLLSYLHPSRITSGPLGGGKRRVQKLIVALLTIGSYWLGGKELLREDLPTYASPDRIVDVSKRVGLHEQQTCVTEWEAWGIQKHHLPAYTGRPPGGRVGGHRRVPELQVATANVLTAKSFLRRYTLSWRFKRAGLDVIGG